MARVLALETTKVLVLDEFTSLVDRPTAKRMAKGLQNLLNQRSKWWVVELETCWVGLSDFFGIFLPLHRAFMAGLAIKMDKGRDRAECITTLHVEPDLFQFGVFLQ